MRSRPTVRLSTRNRGSALLPMVAAMLILLLCGVALSEAFGSQRLQSVMHVETTQAAWIAEAGLWHAAHEESEISSAVDFGGGTYVVAKSGHDYSSTGVFDQATCFANRTMFSTEGPLDVPASVATIERKSNKKFKLDLVSISVTDVVIESFELSADDSTYDGHRFKLDKKKIWHDHQGASLPTGVTELNEGNTNRRTVEALDDPSLEYQSHSQPSGTIAYTLVLHFTNGASSTLDFSVSWNDDDDDDDDD